jgi:hypothetical protein
MIRAPTGREVAVPAQNVAQSRRRCGAVARWCCGAAATHRLKWRGAVQRRPERPPAQTSLTQHGGHADTCDHSSNALIKDGHARPPRQRFAGMRQSQSASRYAPFPKGCKASAGRRAIVTAVAVTPSLIRSVALLAASAISAAEPARIVFECNPRLGSHASCSCARTETTIPLPCKPAQLADSAVREPPFFLKRDADLSGNL